MEHGELDEKLEYKSEEESLDNSNILFHINADNKYVNTNDEIHIITSSIANTHKSMEIIKSVIDKLYDQIEFLKEELREKTC